MAVLTWRNVDAPQFSGAIEGQRLSSQLLSNAFKSIGDGLEQFKAGRTEEADAAALAAANKYQDPEAYKTALASGEIMAGINPAHVSSQAQSVLGNRVGSLLTNATNQYALNRTQEVDTNTDAAREGLMAISQAAARGDQAGIAAAQEKYGPQLSMLPADQIVSTMKNIQGLEGGALVTDSRRLSNQQAVRSDSDTQSAISAVNDIMRQSANADDARLGLEQMDLTPGARNNATAALSRLFPGLYAPIGGSTAPAAGTPVGSGSTGFAANIPFAETRDYVSTITGKAGVLTGSIEEKAEKLMPFLIEKESGGDNSAVSSKGARGVTQVMRATGEDPGYGVKPLQNQSEEEYRRFGKDYLTAMLRKYDGNVEQALAAYNAGPGNVDEWVADPNINRATEEVLAVSGQELMAGNVASNAAQDLVKNFGNNATPLSVSTQLSEGEFKGSDPVKIAKKVTEIMNNSAKEEYGGKGTPTINAAQAGAIIQRNFAVSNPVWADGNTGFTDSNWGDEVGVSDDGIEAAIKAHNSGSSVDQALTNAARTAVMGKISTAQQQYAAAQQALVAVTQRARTQPGIKDTIPRYRNELAMAERNLQALLQSQQQSGQ
jgi:hypothetical protein